MIQPIRLKFSRWVAIVGVAAYAGVFASASVLAAPSTYPSVTTESKKSSKKSRAKTALPTLLREISEKYEAAGSLSAEFTQVNESALTKKKKTSSGTLLVKRPGKVRWETQKPDKSLLVSNGKKFWFYTPPFDEGEHGQVIIRKSSEVKSKLAHSLLAGSFAEAKDLKIKPVGSSEFLLLPKAGTAGTVQSAKIFIDTESKTISKVILEHRDGNRSEIALSKIELGRPLEDETFEFNPPAGTDQMIE